MENQEDHSHLKVNTFRMNEDKIMLSNKIYI